MGPKPSKRCQVCRHDERWRIELLRASGASFESLAEKFNVDRDSIWRHWHKHVSPELKAQYLCGPAQLSELAEKAANEGASVIDHFRAVRVILMGQLVAVSDAGDARAVAFVAGRLTQVLEKIGQITGEISELARSTLNVTNNVLVMSEHPAFMKMQAAMLRALADEPAARIKVVAALRELDGEAAQHVPGAMQVIEHHAA